MSSYGLLLALEVLCVVGYAEMKPRKLVYVQAIWRHGDRAPSKLPYPNDPNTESQWPRGWGQLTNTGIKELYNLGKFFRARYNRFIGATFRPEKLMLTSTSSLRAIASAQAFLRGLFPAYETDICLEGEHWQPIPFYSRSPYETDPLLRPTDFNCPLYTKIMRDQNKETFKNIQLRYPDLLSLLRNVTGYRVLNLDKLVVLDNVYREVIHNLPQPNWVTKTWHNYGNKTTMDLINGLKALERYNEFNSRLKARLRGGYLLGDFMQRVKNVSANKLVRPKRMNLYSAHDGTISALMFAMGIADSVAIPYAACLIMEVFRTNNRNYEVKMIYRNQTNSDRLYTLVIPGCTEYCPVEMFQRILAPMAIYSERELEQACCRGVNDGYCYTVNSLRCPKYCYR